MRKRCQTLFRKNPKVFLKVKCSRFGTRFGRGTPAERFHQCEGGRRWMKRANAVKKRQVLKCWRRIDMPELFEKLWEEARRQWANDQFDAVLEHLSFGGGRSPGSHAARRGGRHVSGHGLRNFRGRGVIAALCCATEHQSRRLVRGRLCLRKRVPPGCGVCLLSGIDQDGARAFGGLKVRRRVVRTPTSAR